MTLTISPPTNDSRDLAVLNLSRLFARLEHNLLSPSADLKSLRRSEYQRMRVGANVEYARTNLHALERTLPTIKALDHRHELQTDLTRKRQTLKLLQDILDDIAAEAEVRSAREAEAHVADADDDDDDDAEEDLLDGEDAIITPEGDSTPERVDSSVEGGDLNRDDVVGDDVASPQDEQQSQQQPTPITTTTTTHDNTLVPTTTIPAITTEKPTLRNRHHTQPSQSSATAAATATGTSHHDTQSTEQTLSTHRLEQEDLTSSLLSLASQLKSSSQSFQSALDSEKSVLSRAVDGIDRTTTNMEAAGKRMGLLRRMTEGKGWWGRMILYAWIFGLWLVAILIVFLGPKLRF
ncbi:hypothetical protein ASPWEDRAFT_40367 [Aspergillus wentii DTO 134E9]|uniref:Synaptobrevin n=1 Tax=Aspergillus wentii DTO 134E9 TaxID=1073089 RepID=A0A1L9RJV4_ASPWE|nr:uncharacterized protein ASPWEDRAFT_40367 [Aspergillus wentii DTO 134E9]OJJ35181.1 hypothetical protein ASPWEDRAFT_40367 [Aspergillus wentii DTO 134E9]